MGVKTVERSQNKKKFEHAYTEDVAKYNNIATDKLWELILIFDIM